MFFTDIFVATGGRPRARRCLAWAALLILGIGSVAGAGQATDPAPTVREERGVYVVSAEFTVPAPAAARSSAGPRLDSYSWRSSWFTSST